jgi:hypothetical protein
VNSATLKGALKVFLDTAYSPVVGDDSKILAYENVNDLAATFGNFALSNDLDISFVGNVKYGANNENDQIKTVSVWIIGSLVLKVVVNTLHEDSPASIEIMFIHTSGNNYLDPAKDALIRTAKSCIGVKLRELNNLLTLGRDLCFDPADDIAALHNEAERILVNMTLVQVEK